MAWGWIGMFLSSCFLGVLDMQRWQLLFRCFLHLTDGVSWQGIFVIDRDTTTTWPSEVSVIEKEARKAAREGGDSSLFVLGNLQQVHL